MKSLAIRLDDELHARLSVIAQLEEITVSDAIRRAIEDYLQHRRSAPEVAAKADAMLAEIERDAETRRQAISSLFASEQSEQSEQPPAKPRPTRTRKSARDQERPASS